MPIGDSTRDRHLGLYGGFKTESLFVPVLCNVDPWADRTRYLLILEIRGSESLSSPADCTCTLADCTCTLNNLDILPGRNRQNQSG